MNRTDPTATTASPGTRALGALGSFGVVLLCGFAFVWSPADVEQGDLVRLMYVHVPVAILAFAMCFLTSLASAMWLRRRTDGWDALGHAAAEVGALLAALTLVTGMVWGRPTWGAYWVWDARLTSTALLMLLLLGYLALRRYPGEATARRRAASILGLLLVPNVIVVHYSVDWWRSLHQSATITRLDPQIDGLLLFTLVLGIAVGAVVTAWLVVHRFRLAWLEQRCEEHRLDLALSQRLADSDSRAGTEVGAAR